MSVNPEPAPDVQARMQALQRPHERFPAWRKDQLYDAVTSMYQECYDDEEIARTLARMSCPGITGVMANTLRQEAATMAETLTYDIRKKWIYRFKRPTVNNLVKEYMFLESKKSFIQAKRELADEVERLQENTSPEKLCVAINDAVGRNNIGMELIRELVAYAQAARKIDASVGLLAKSGNQPASFIMEQIARKLKTAFEKDFGKDLSQTLPLLAGLLHQPVQNINEDDAELMLEYIKICDDGVDGIEQPVFKRTKGVDMFLHAKSLTEQVLGGMGRHMNEKELRFILEEIRSAPVLSTKDLETLKAYAKRHLSDLDTLEKLNHFPQNRDLRQNEVKKLDAMLRLIQRHLSLSDVKAFLSSQELHHAAQLGLDEAATDHIMRNINNLETTKAVEDFARTLQTRTNFIFPVTRYLSARFSDPY